MYTREQIEAAVKAKGYVWFSDVSNKNYDVNIVGVRSLAQGNAVTNVFDDFLTISYKKDGQWQFHCWMATTDPGTKGVKEFQNSKGVARVVEGQYRGLWQVGMHKQTYQALTQKGKVKVYRDKNKDLVFDETIVDEGVFGINCHRSNAKTQSEYVENWSEGCQVFKAVADFNAFMAICNEARKIHGNSFTYTLLSNKDIL